AAIFFKQAYSFLTGIGFVQGVFGQCAFGNSLCLVPVINHLFIFFLPKKNRASVSHSHRPAPPAPVRFWGGTASYRRLFFCSHSWHRQHQKPPAPAWTSTWHRST